MRGDATPLMGLTPHARGGRRPLRWRKETARCLHPFSMLPGFFKKGDHMPGHDIIAIGGSAGGVSTAQELIQRLPRDLPASLFLVLHLAPYSRSYLPEILSRAGPF